MSCALDEKSQIKDVAGLSGKVHHWLRFWFVSSLVHVVCVLVEHGNPESMPSLYYLLKIAVTVWMSLPEYDACGWVMERAITPFVKPHIPQVDKLLRENSSQARESLSSLVNKVSSKTASKPAPLPESQ